MPQAQFSIQTGHIFNQSPAQVYDHWLNGLNNGRWLFATTTGRMQGARYRIAPGGHFVVQQGKLMLRGQWLNMQRPHLLFFSFLPADHTEQWREPDLVQLNFSSHPLGCEVRLTHQTCAQWRGQADKLVEGWTHILASLTAELNDNRLACGQLFV